MKNEIEAEENNESIEPQKNNYDDNSYLLTRMNLNSSFKKQRSQLQSNAGKDQSNITT